MIDLLKKDQITRLFTLFFVPILFFIQGCGFFLGPRVLQDITTSEFLYLKENNEKLTLSRGAYTALIKRYQADKGRIAFAVTKNGRAWEYWKCNKGTCSTRRGYKKLLSFCNNMDLDGECRILYLRDQKIYPYEINVDKNLNATIIRGAKTKNQGPYLAKGVILYVPGYGGWGWPAHPDDDVIPSFIKSLNGKGYDIFKVNIPYYNMTPAMKPEIAQYLASLPLEYFSKGYDNVVFIGQSRGAWSILQASEKLNDDRISYVLNAPAAHGSEDDKDNTLVKADKEFRKLVMKSNARNVVFFFFQNDTYATGKFPNLTRKVMKDKKNWHIVENPNEFSGHGSIWTRLYDRTFTDSLDVFFQNHSFSWKNVIPKENDVFDFASIKQVKQYNLEKLTYNGIVQEFDHVDIFYCNNCKNPWIKLVSNVAAIVNLGSKDIRGSHYRTWWEVKNGQFVINYLHHGNFDENGRLKGTIRRYDVYKHSNNKYILVRLDNMTAYPVTIIKR
jgi:hypothetical protein